MFFVNRLDYNFEANLISNKMGRVNGVINLLFNLMATGGFVVAYLKEFSPATEAKLEKSGILIFKNYGGRYKYLTILNLVSFCLLN